MKLNNKNIIIIDIKFLIEFLFLKLHNEQKMDNNNNRIKDSETNLYEIYCNERDMITKFYSKNSSIIRELFFFDMQLYNYENNGNYEYSINFALDIEIEKINKNKVNIYDILNYINKEYFENKEKNKYFKVITNFNYCPKYLIIIIRKIGDNNIEFEYNEKINISSYTTNINDHKDFCEYELVSIIENYFITFCKSSEDNQWYKYDGKYDRDPSKIK